MKSIEESAGMSTASVENLRSKVLEIAKRHKASWIELGQYLFSIHKDKLFKQWSYMTFETYCFKELGLKQTTASKLLKSYYFLEKEEPSLCRPETVDEVRPAVVPNYESVNLLRLAKDNPNLDAQDFRELRKSVLTSAKEPKDVRAQMKQMMANRAEEQDPKEVRRSKRNAAIKRVLMVLGGAKKELEQDDLLPAYLITQMKDLIDKLQDQVEN